jgi:2-polyprenyl-3-methyl-5-hydroxy-6-metoxy-1,4-benzoquinol methylase
MLQESNTPQEIDYNYHYRKWHSDRTEHVRAMKSFYQKMLSPYLPSDRNITILDVGCGMGFALLALQDFGYEKIQGIDIDRGQVMSCLDKGIKAIQVKDSVQYLLEHANSYDLIISFDVVEHIPYEGQLDFLKAVNKALKPTGQLICTVPNASSGLASRWRYIDWTHHASFTEHSLDFLLYNAGFKNNQIFGTEYFSRPSLKSLLRVTPWLHWLLFLTVRGFRRLEVIAELGWQQGNQIPLSLNLIALATKN